MIRPASCCAWLSCLLLAASAAAEPRDTEPPQPVRYQVDLPAGTLHKALLALGRQTRVSLFFAEESVAGLTSPALRGEFDLGVIFDTLLTDPCLRYEYVRERLVAISRACPVSAGPALSAGVSDTETERSPARPDNPVVEELVVREGYVTGSRLRNAEFGQTMPLDVIDQTEIRLSGLQAVGEILRYVPAVAGNSTSTLISNGGDGTATVTLRGLPASNTLVLLNGRRLNTNALDGKSVDLNSIPLAMVEQIDILKDGVSAIYGSDAVAGVVNILTRKRISGVSFDAYRGVSERSDLETTHASLLAGHEGDVLTGSIGLSYYEQGGILSRDRSRSLSSHDRVLGGIDKRSSATVPARVHVGDVPFILGDGNSGSVSTDFRPATTEDRFEFRDFTSSVVPSERHSVFGEFTWQINTDVTAYGEGLFTHTESDSHLAPVPVLTGFESIPLPIAAQQAYNPFGVTITDLRRRVTELPARRQINESDTLRLVAGAMLDLERMHLDASIQYNRTHATESFQNGIHAGRLAAALRADCVAPCVPVNLFGPHGSISPSMLDYIGTSASISGRSSLLTGAVSLDWQMWEVPAGSIEMSSGLEIRRESLSTHPDQTLSHGLLVGGGNRGEARGHREVIEAYAEVYVPLLDKAPGFHRLDTQLAVRYSQYSDFGHRLTPRAVLSWQPIRQWQLRGSFGLGFRAPSLTQLHASPLQSFEQLNDPCSVAANVPTLSGCSLASDPALTQFLTLTGGDTSLDPERSKSMTLGTVVEQHWGRSELEVSVDWYRIEQRDVVESSAQYIVNQNARLGRFRERVDRDANGNINRVLATLQNIGQRQVSGYDFAATLATDLSRWGLFTVALNATHITAFQDQFDPDSPTVEKAGTFSDEASGGLGALPDWKWNFGVSWQHRYWQGYYNIYQVSALREEVPLLETVRTIRRWTSHNLNLAYLGPITAWSRVTLGVNNLFDQKPPFAAAAFNDSYDGRTYDITGRFFFVKLHKEF